MNIIGYILLIIGGVFYFLGGLGIFRMAGSKATTLGAFSLILGIGFLNPTWFMKIIILVVFMTITNPVGSSTLARASYLHKAKTTKLQRDDLKLLYQEQEMRKDD